MATLSEDDIEKLFSGAPQYFARSEGHFSGAPHPSVAFPFDEELEIRDLTDHVQIEDKAWSGVTAWPHLTRDINQDAKAKRQAREKQRAHFHVRCRERPNMLSMQGLEKGTMGYQAALEFFVSDSAEEVQFGFESVGTKARAVIEARRKMLSHAGWLCRLPEAELLDRLRRNGERYHHNPGRSRTSLELYRELFNNFMRPCTFVIDKTDHHSLLNQINALVKCLATVNVWIDLSRVEWRIRLGQILWGEQDGDELDDATSIHDAATVNERVEEKYWLLMQILLSTELLLRLDIITEGDESDGGEYFRPTDVAYFERSATQMVKWSILLARSWLENIQVIKEEEAFVEKRRQLPRTNGWLESLVSRISLHNHERDKRPLHTLCAYTFKGRHAQRQVEGLLHFARKLKWPSIDSYEEYEDRISASIHNTELDARARTDTSTDKSLPQQASHFGAWDVTRSRYHKNDRKQDVTRFPRRKMAAALHAQGWLSKSYVFGLMLPGEAMSHFLMATLLENDSAAMEALGPFANLGGGFVYSGKSFWSTSCVVGRVLAAGRGSAECMGWISTDILPAGFEGNWVAIEVEAVPEDRAILGKKARIWWKKKIERESSILGDAADGSVMPVDFIIPHENVYTTPPANVCVELQSLELSSAAGTLVPTPLSVLTATPSLETGKLPEQPTYPASLSFTVSTWPGREKKCTFGLSYDVSFVTAHPCSPSQRVRFLKSPSSPTLREFGVSGSPGVDRLPAAAHRMGHPLHKFYNYIVIHISTLLEQEEASLEELLSGSPTNKPNAIVPKVKNNHVLVIDCMTNIADVPQRPRSDKVITPSSSPAMERRGSFPAAAKMLLESRTRQFGSDLEIMVRALCAKKGWNAIISRRKRGCLACAIREAGALAWRVVVRVE